MCMVAPLVGKPKSQVVDTNDCGHQIPRFVSCKEDEGHAAYEVNEAVYPSIRFKSVSQITNLRLRMICPSVCIGRFAAIESGESGSRLFHRYNLLFLHNSNSLPL
jgi:hypothetical protein